MFKRVEKRRLKKEEEEELGLDEEMKEVLGMHDTDSDESASDDDDSDSEDDQEEAEGDDGESGDEGHSGAEDDDDDEEEEEGGDEEEEEDPNVSVSQALIDPVYVVSILPEVKACIVCPGKLLKGAKMVQLHRVSNAHERRVRQFKALAADADPKESAWEVLQRAAEEKPKLSLAPVKADTTATSKRAEKKKAHAAKLKLRREKAKAKREKDALKKKALAAAGAGADPSGSSPTKTPASKEPKTNTDAAKPSKSKKDKSATPKPAADLPPKKKRKVVEPTAETETGDVPADVAVSVPPRRVKKPKHLKVAEAVAAASGGSPTKSSVAADAKDSVKDVARSISDRAKNARQRAISTSKGAKGDSNPRRKKPAAST